MDRLKAKSRKRIAVIGVPILPSHSAFNAVLSRYADTHNWQFVFSMEASVRSFRMLRQLDCDGALVRIISPEMDREALRLKIPVVNFSAWLAEPGVTTVRRDDHAAGRMCAEHLLGKGFRRFGIVSVPGGAFVKMRRDAFCQTVAASGFERGIREHIIQSLPLKMADRQRFKKWLMTLPAPAGLFLADDVEAPALMDLCREAGYRIPQDLAVLTGYYHEEVAMACVPPLTSVFNDEESLAWREAEALDLLMAGHVLPQRVISLPLCKLIVLGSTNSIAVDDPDVAKAVELIRTHAATVVGIDELVDTIPISRSSLDRRFRDVMGKTLHEYLVGERMELAKDCLVNSPKLRLDEVARQCGLTTRKNMNIVFKRHLNKLPAAFRRQALKAKTQSMM